MTIRRAPDDERGSYTVIDNRTVQDSKLSWEARGMLAFLLSKPSKWSVQPPALVKESPGAKRDKVYQILNELEECGYLITRRITDDAGRFVKVERWVYEISQPTSGISVSGEGVSEPEPESEDRQAARRLCEYLNQWLTINGYKPALVNTAALNVMERLLRIDKHAEANVRTVIDWAMTDDFWCGNVRSPEKLRKNYDTLIAQMKRTKSIVPVEPDTKEIMRRQAEKAERDRLESAPMPKNLKDVLRGKS